MALTVFRDQGIRYSADFFAEETVALFIADMVAFIGALASPKAREPQR